MKKTTLFFAIVLTLKTVAQTEPVAPTTPPAQTEITPNQTITPAISTETPAVVPAVIMPPPQIIIGDGCPYYKVKITLNSGQIFNGLITSDDCATSETMSDENLMKQIKTVKKREDNSFEMFTQYNILTVLDKNLVYYDFSSVIKIQKIEVKAATVIEKTSYFDHSKFTDYMGSKRIVTLMKHQTPVSVVEINFSDEDCEVKTSYILVNYHPKVNEIDLRKFAEVHKDTFIVDCDETDNDARIKKLLEPLNIVYFKEETE
jgi:hypothetical protein